MFYLSTAGPTTDNIPCPCLCGRGSGVAVAITHGLSLVCPGIQHMASQTFDVICSKIADTSAKLCELCGLLCGEQLTGMVRMSAGKTGGYEATTQLVYLGKAGPSGQARPRPALGEELRN